MTELFYRLAGPLAILAFLLWLYSQRRVLGEFWHLRQNRLWQTALFSLAGAALVFASVPVGLKVLSDETNLLSVANMLSQFGRASNTQMWVYYYHEYHPLDYAMPTRPVLFPALTAMVQAAIGMGATAAFVVNFLVYTVLVGAAMFWAQGFGLAALLVLPLVWMNAGLSVMATSGGFDLLSLFFAFAVFLALKTYLQRKDQESFLALVFAAICFASVRYESILVLPVFIAALFWFERRELFQKLNWTVVFWSVLLLAPLLLQRWLTWGQFENPPGVAPFSLEHLWNHAPVFFKSFFWDWSGSYPVLLHWLGVLGLIIWLRTRKTREEKALTLAAGSYAGLQLLLLLSHHFGFADHPTQIRLFVPLSFYLSLAAFPVIARFQSRLGAGLVAVPLVLLFLHHHQVALRDELTNRLTMTREVRFLQDFFAQSGGFPSGDLYVYDRPGQISALGGSAVSWSHFEAKRGDFEKNRENGLYQRVLFIERVPYSVKDRENQGRWPKRRPLFARQLSATESLVVSQME